MALAQKPALLATARSLSIDRVAAEVAEGLAARGLDCMLVKGAATARALYADGGQRAYVDCDLLVRRRDVPDADAVLESLGFSLACHDDAVFRDDLLHGHTWARARDRATVDLHWTFVGVEDPEGVWDAFRARAEIARVGGRDLAVADAPTTALLAALQLLQHGPDRGGEKFVRDLDRALAQLDVHDWRAAAELAAATGAERAFGAGLRLVPDGDEIAERLGLPDDAVARSLARGGQAEFRAEWLEALVRRSEPGARVRLLARLVVPPRAYIEHVHPAARRGRPYLAVFYARWLLKQIARLPTTLLAWRRARSEAHG